MSNFKNDDDLNEKMLDEITRRVVEESKDKKHSNDDGMENDYDFMRTEIEGELIALGFDEEWVYDGCDGLIEESLDKVLEVSDDEEEEESDDEEDVCCVLCNGYVCKFCEEVEHKDERDEAICDTCYHEHY